MAKMIATIYRSASDGLSQVQPDVDRDALRDLSAAQRRIALFQLAWAMAFVPSYRSGDRASEDARLTLALSYLRDTLEAFPDAHDKRTEAK